MSIKKIAIVLNGFIHDFMTGYWLSALITIWFLHRFQVEQPVVASHITVIQRFFFWNSIGATVVILATGAGRTFTYVEDVFGATTESTRRKMLIIKHVFLFVVFGLGGWSAYCMSFQ